MRGSAFDGLLLLRVTTPNSDKRQEQQGEEMQKALLLRLLTLTLGIAVLPALLSAREVPLLSFVGEPYGTVRALATDEERNLTFVASGGTVYTVDLNDPAVPQQLSEVTIPGVISDLAYAGQILFVADQTYGLRVIDTTDPAAPQAVGSIPTQGGVTGIAVSSSFVYAAAGVAGLLVIDISDPAAPQAIEQLETASLVIDVAVEDTFAYVVSNQALRVIDLTDPASPRRRGSVAMAIRPRDVKVQGDQAYIAAGNIGLIIIDVRNPSEPIEAGQYDTPGTAWSLAVRDTLAYIADGRTLRLIDVSNPAEPQEVGFYDHEGGGVRSMVVRDTRAYVAASFAGLIILDVSDPSQPVELGSYAPAISVRGVAVEGTRAYIAAGDDGLRIVDVSRPDEPRELGRYDPSGSISRVAVEGTLVHVSPDLRVLDVSDPAQPQLLSVARFPGPNYWVHVADGLAYVAVGEAGLSIWRTVDITVLEGEDGQGMTSTRSRGAASGGATARFTEDGQVWTQDFTMSLSQDYQVRLRYSNDGPFDQLEVRIIEAENLVGSPFQTVNTRISTTFGSGWNVFASVDLGTVSLDAGSYTIEVTVVDTDSTGGFELDFISLTPAL